MNQFGSIYGQLFCCNCPGGFPGVHCNNKTGILLTYPLVSGSNYSWVAGLLCILFIIVLSISGSVYCCKHRRTMYDNEMVNIIPFANTPLGEDEMYSQTQGLVQPAWKNSGFCRNRVKEDTSIEEEVMMKIISPSEESTDSLFNCQDSCNELDDIKISPLSKDGGQDTSS